MSEARPTLVFLRGLIRSRYHWAGFPQRFSDYPVIEAELPGNGYRYDELTPGTIPAMMLEIRQQVRAQVDGPIVLIAISMGGMIATEWARQFPEEIQAMHQINTSLANLSLPWERMSASGFFRLMACAGRRLPLERTIYSQTINREVDNTEVTQWLDFAKAHPLQWRNVFVQLIAASRYRGPLSSPIQDVWFYNAAGDRLVRPECTERIAARWHKPLITHPTAGHDMPVDAPDWLESQLRRNLSHG